MTPWVRRLIAANVLVYLLQQAVPSVTQEFLLYPPLLLERPWMLVTYMFLHSPTSIWHIAFNMFALWIFGPRVEERLGGGNFIALYLVSGIGGALLSFVPPQAPTLGASGAIMGVMLAYAMYWPRERFLFWGVVPVQVWLLVAAYVVMDVYGVGGIGGAGIAHFAHLGGLISGFLYLKVMQVRSPARSWKKKVAGPKPPALSGDADNVRRWRAIRLDDLHSVNRDEIVRLLDKAQTLGTKSLTEEERATLDRFAAMS
jgi:membrane associated rhomboid family serine protease